MVRAVFEDAYNYMKSGHLLRQVINKISHHLLLGHVHIQRCLVARDAGVRVRDGIRRLLDLANARALPSPSQCAGCPQDSSGRRPRKR